MDKSKESCISDNVTLDTYKSTSSLDEVQIGRKWFQLHSFKVRRVGYCQTVNDKSLPIPVAHASLRMCRTHFLLLKRSHGVHYSFITWKWQPQLYKLADSKRPNSKDFRCNNHDSKECLRLNIFNIVRSKYTKWQHTIAPNRQMR